MSAKVPLQIRTAGGGEVQCLGEHGWRLYLPRVTRGYALAQLDDYADLPRTCFPWRPPVRLRLEARIQPPSPPGTWGFGFWNDPWALLGGGGRRWPTTPQALWFFGASPPNWLSLQPEVPARGFFAGVTTWKGSRWSWLQAMALAPMAWWPWVGHRVRSVFARWMQQWGVVLPPPSQWQRFEIVWEPHQVHFWVEGKRVGTSPYSPSGRLGLVIWVDNQFAAWPPGRAPAWGVLPVPRPVILEIRNLEIHPLPVEHKGSH